MGVVLKRFWSSRISQPVCALHKVWGWREESTQDPFTLTVRDNLINYNYQAELHLTRDHSRSPLTEGQHLKCA